MKKEHFVFFIDEPELHNYGEECPECFMDDSKQYVLFRVETTERGTSVSSFRNGRWIESSDPPTLQEGMEAFQDFISELQGIPDGLRIEEVEGGFQVVDSRTQQPIGELPVFPDFGSAIAACNE